MRRERTPARANAPQRPTRRGRREPATPHDGATTTPQRAPQNTHEWRRRCRRPRVNSGLGRKRSASKEHRRRHAGRVVAGCGDELLQAGSRGWSAPRRLVCSAAITHDGEVGVWWQRRWMCLGRRQQSISGGRRDNPPAALGVLLVCKACRLRTIEEMQSPMAVRSSAGIVHGPATREA